MSEKPRVSFVCSVKDGARHIERCVKSVLRQSLKEIELILVDDHSTDTTWGVMEHIAREDPRVRAARNYGQEGLTYSLNMGLDFARGEYVARIDVDDFAHADRAEKQVSMLDSNPKAVMVAGCYRLIDDGDWFLYSHCPPGDPVMLRWSLCFRNYIRHSTVMWRRSLDIRYEPAFKYAQDYELWCRMSRFGDIVVLGSMSSTIRNRRDSITNTKYEDQEMAADKVAAYQWEHYTGKTLEEKRPRHLRLIQHMKSGEQFQAFNAMDEREFKEAFVNYCTLACLFSDKEKPEMEAFMNDVGNDVRSLLGNPDRRVQTMAALREAAEALGGHPTMREIIVRFFPKD